MQDAPVEPASVDPTPAGADIEKPKNSAQFREVSTRRPSPYDHPQGRNASKSTEPLPAGHPDFDVSEK